MDIDGVVVGSAVHVQRVRTIKISDTGLLSTSSLGILASHFLTYLGMFQKILASLGVLILRLAILSTKSNC